MDFELGSLELTATVTYTGRSGFALVYAIDPALDPAANGPAALRGGRRLRRHRRRHALSRHRPAPRPGCDRRGIACPPWVSLVPAVPRVRVGSEPPHRARHPGPATQRFLEKPYTRLETVFL